MILQFIIPFKQSAITEVKSLKYKSIFRERLIQSQFVSKVFI